MRVLVACEYSGIVRDAFWDAGHYAVSCDLLPTERPGRPHFQCDVRKVLHDGWDMLIAHPPCTHLAVSGARWFKNKSAAQQEEAVSFVRMLLEAPIRHIAIENPVGVLSTRLRPPDQIVQPWWFGAAASKRTCLWLKNLPPLRATRLAYDDDGWGSKLITGERVQTKGGRSLPKWYDSTSKLARGQERSKTFPEFAVAMASQWGTVSNEASK